MFTGIVEEIGTLEKIQKGTHSAILTIKAHKVLEDTKIGDSIAVNGICLTVTTLPAGCFTADVMHETLNRSSLAGLSQGSQVNLERAMAADSRFGGHIVSGHVDGIGKISGIQKDDNAIWYTIEAKPEILRYVVEKGSITIDGISLTVARVNQNSFSISAIPHTVAQTILKEKKMGDVVNLETDIIGKYVEKLLGQAPAVQSRESTITRDFLTKYGF
ncbi:MAG: riboflavin synthase [Lachnospiraceae bacterium]|nr:riboflavin synthase [Lachnospiraceae bacterium]